MRDIFSNDSLTPKKSTIMHDVLKKAMSHNTSLMKTFHCKKIMQINAFPSSELSYVIAFRLVSFLKKMFYLRINWNAMESALAGGFSSNFKPISDS